MYVKNEKLTAGRIVEVMYCGKWTRAEIVRAYNGVMIYKPIEGGMNGIEIKTTRRATAVRVCI